MTPLKLSDIRTSRFTTGKNGRLLPLNSDAWRKLRKMVLSEQPLCPECEARNLIEVATQVHHINDNAMDNSRDNLVGLCASCHSRHTAADMGKRVSMGCDTTGQPLDASHHWNKSPATDAPEPIGLPHVNANRKSQP